tara:strand:+ start:253 stop:918 length:666 start_codon:yes stop_codon:yes gene_type:complete
MIFSKEFAIKFYPKYIDLFERLNNNVLFHKTIKSVQCKQIYGDYNDYLNTFIKNEISDRPIDYLEFGVYGGRRIKQWIELNKHPDSRFFGFDTFTGLPEEFQKNHPKGKFNVNGQLPVINDKRVKFIKGLFQETLDNFLKQFTKNTDSILVIHLDADLYSSTLYCLTKLDHLLRDSFVMFDEFGDLQHEFAAFYDYTHSYYRKYTILYRHSNWRHLIIRIN